MSEVPAIAPVPPAFTLVSSRSFVAPASSAGQYFASGTYVWSSQARGIGLSIDGRPWRTSSPMRLRGGLHRLVLTAQPFGFAPLLFARVDAAPLPPPSPITVAQRSATSWTVRTIGATTLELAQLDDGNWFARDAARTTFGYPCDLINTCFDVGAGDAYVGRRLPPLLALGFAITLADLLVAFGVLYVPSFGRRTKAA